MDPHEASRDPMEKSEPRAARRTETRPQSERKLAVFPPNRSARRSSLSTRASARPKGTTLPLNKSKRSLRSTLEELAANFADAAIAAARESLFEYAQSAQSRQQPQARTQARAVTPRDWGRSAVTTAKSAGRKPRAAKSRAADKRESVAPEATGSGASELLITDPLALLAALETADAPSVAVEQSYEARASRKGPDILEPVASSVAEDAPVVAISRRASSAPAADESSFAPVRAPALREGEVIVRRSAGGVVLRRRRG